jgi:hypothetical protein
VGYIATLLLTTISFGLLPQQPDIHQKAPEILEIIERARDTLRGERVELIKGTVGFRRVRVARRKYKQVPIIGVVGREMAIAVADSRGKLTTVRAIKRDRGIEVSTSGITLLVRRDNGINSDIACLVPKGGKVVAVKYPVSNEGGRFGPGPDVIEALYTPYSPEVKTDETIARGIEVQADLIQSAFTRLRQRGVYSLAFPGKKVVEVIPRDVLTVLLMNEHIDPSLFKSSGMTKSMVEQVLTVIATNRETAYAYSISPAGARGLVQMIPSTYYLIARKYPSAGLLSNFSAGMVDAINAMMAQVLLCDADWQAIRTKADIPVERIGPYLAAAYNGGVGRVLTILAHDQSEWMESPDVDTRPTMTVTKKVRVRVKSKKGRVRTVYVTKRYEQPILRSETTKYVNQYHWINDYFSEAKSDPDRAPRAGSSLLPPEFFY